MKRINYLFSYRDFISSNLALKIFCPTENRAWNFIAYKFEYLFHCETNSYSLYFSFSLWSSYLLRPYSEDICNGFNSFITVGRHPIESNKPECTKEECNCTLTFRVSHVRMKCWIHDRIGFSQFSVDVYEIVQPSLNSQATSKAGHRK